MNMNMMNTNNVILSLPVNFSSPQRASQAETEPNKKIGRKDTGSTAATDLTSSFRSGYSIGTNDEFDDFIASLEAAAEYCHDADATALEEEEEDEVLMKLMSYQQGTREIIQPGGSHHGTTTTTTPTEKIKKISVHNQAKFDSLAIEVARLEEKLNRCRMQMRRMKHQVRILDAKNEYLECLEALLPDDEFMRDHGLVWKEVELDGFE